MNQQFCTVHSEHKKEPIGMENTLWKIYWVEVKYLKESVNMNSTEFILVELKSIETKRMIDRKDLINLIFNDEINKVKYYKKNSLELFLNLI